MRLNIKEFGARVKKRWPLLLLALSFTAVGLTAFSAAVSMVWKVHQMQSWQPIQAHLEHAELHSQQGDNSTTYSVRALYHYDFEGRTYRSDRVLPVAIQSGNSLAQRLADYLESALSDGRPVVAWVNPNDPAQAVLYREQRWGSFTFMASFGLMFGGVGLVLLWLCLPSPSSGTRAEVTAPEQPWQRYRPWATSSIQSDARTNVGFVKFFTLIWNLFAFPMALIALSEVKEKPEAIIALLFPLIGIGLMILTYAMAKRWRRFGYTPLQMDPYPGAIGGHVGGVIDLPLPFSPHLQFKASLTCIHSYLRGSGDEQERREDILWQTNGFARTRDHNGTIQLEVLFDVEEGLPSSDIPSNGDYHVWSLRIQAIGAGIQFHRSFDIPVFPTGATSKQLRELSTEHNLAVDERLEAIESVLDLQQIPGGVEIFYPPYRKPALKVVGIVLGVVLLMGGIFAGSVGVPMTLSWALSVLGLLTAAMSFYWLAVSLKVRLDDAGLLTEKRLWGRRVGGKQVSRHELRGLRIDQSTTVQTGQTYTVYYKLQAITQSNQTIKIGHNLAGREAATQTLEAISVLTGIPVEAEEDKSSALA